MGKGFTSPSGAPPKMKVGKVNRPKRSSEGANGLSAQPRDYAITDSFAAKTIPGFVSRKPSSHTKSAFNTKPLRSSGKGF